MSGEASAVRENVVFLLSDEYVQFSQRIAELHALKKACKEEFKKKHEEYQANLKSFDAQAAEALDEWETWKEQNKLKGK